MEDHGVMCGMRTEEDVGCATTCTEVVSRSEEGPDNAAESFPPMLVEVICERAHCVIYEYAIVTVKFIADEFKGRIKIKPVVRRGSKKNVDRYLELCRLNGKHLSVPAILMDGKLTFTCVPGIEDLRKAMEENLADWKQRLRDGAACTEGDELPNE
jgi:hypothetical protein